MHEEQWLPVPSYEGTYSVSSHGRVRRDGIILKTNFPSARYALVQLSKNGKVKTAQVHRLVAAAFVPRVEGRNQINHIDGDRTNNHATNLEWVTQTENMRHAVRIGLVKSGRAAHLATISEATIHTARKMLRGGKSQRTVASSLGISQKSVWRFARA